MQELLDENINYSPLTRSYLPQYHRMLVLHCTAAPDQEVIFHHSHRHRHSQPLTSADNPSTRQIFEAQKIFLYSLRRYFSTYTENISFLSDNGN